MSTDIKSMFESIKASLTAEKQGNTSYRNVLKLDAGNTYLVRIIPNVKDPKATFLHYTHHGFNSNATGQYVDATCPRAYGDKCPICEARFKLYKTKDPSDKELAYRIRDQEKHYVNIYVIDDPVNKENNGTVKLLRFGKRVHDKIVEATEGDDALEFGSRIFDLSENGCNFKIKVESVSDTVTKRQFVNYSNSRFTAASAIPGMTPEKLQEVYEGIFDLKQLVEHKTEEELQAILKNHVYCEASAQTQKPSAPAPRKEEPREDDIPMEFAQPKATKPTKTEPAAKASDDEKIKSLLAGLDSL